MDEVKTLNHFRQAGLKSRGEQSAELRCVPDISDIREQRRRNKVTKMLKTVNLDAKYNSVQLDAPESSEHLFNSTKVTDSKKHFLSRSKTPTSDSKMTIFTPDKIIKAEVEKSFEFPEHDNPHFERSPCQKVDHSEFFTQPKEIIRASVFSSTKPSSNEWAENNLRDSSNLIRDAKPSRDTLSFAKPESMAKNKSPYKTQSSKTEGKTDLLAHLRARYMPEHSSSLVSLGSKQQMLSLSKAGPENQKKTLIDPQQKYQSNNSMAKTTSNFNKSNKIFEEVRSIGKRLSVNMQERHSSLKKNGKTVAEAKGETRNQCHPSPAKLSKANLAGLSEAQIPRLRPRALIMESKLELKSQLVNCFGSLGVLDTEAMSNGTCNTEEIETIFDKSVAERLANLKQKHKQKKSNCSPPESDNPRHFKSSLERIKNQAMKEANIHTRKPSTVTNNENWLDASFDQDCTNISKIDQLYAGLCADSTRQYPQMNFFS